MNFACSSHDKEERGEEGRRKLPSVGVSDVMRWFGRLLKRRRIREWWPDSTDGGRRKRFVEEREMLEGENRESRGCCLVASWWGVQATAGSGDGDETTVVGMVVVEGTVERKGEEREKNCRVNFYTFKTRGIGRMFLEIIFIIFYS